MNENEQWLNKAILMTLQVYEVDIRKRAGLTDDIMRLVKIYEAMEEADNERS